MSRPMMELDIPVTTSPDGISKALREDRPGHMTVVYCTYRSLPLVERAQQEGAPALDILCDEAHRATAGELPGNKRASPFVLVHGNAHIRGGRRSHIPSPA